MKDVGSYSSGFHTHPNLIQIININHLYISLRHTCEAVVEVDTASRAVVEHITTDDV